MPSSLFQGVGTANQAFIWKKKKRESLDLLALTEKLKLPISLLQSLVFLVKLIKTGKEVEETAVDVKGSWIWVEWWDIRKSD